MIEGYMKLLGISRDKMIWILCTATLLFLWVFGLFMVYQDSKKDIKSYLTTELVELEDKVKSTIRYYELFSNYVYEAVVNNDEVSLMMYKALNASNDTDRDLIRQELQSLLEDDYSIIQTYDFRQLHFHMPDNTSFLRMHRPEKYGDDLTDIRESVRICNEQKIYVTGFEEGKIFNGYRFVYPLSYNDTHIGSVEVSLSMASVIDTFSHLYPGLNTYFILDYLAVEEKVFDDEMSNYVTSKISEDYLADIEVEDVSMANNMLFTLAEETDFLKGIADDINPLIEGGESFNIIEKYDGANYLIQFLRINNIKKSSVGYFISIRNDEQIGLMIKDQYRRYISISVVFVLILLIGIMLLQYQTSLKRRSNIDYLTQVYNRNKFTELITYEFKRYRRYFEPFSVLMIDIDKFKHINDTYGHNKGDLVLKNLAALVKKEIRSNDILARWGGEEFICMLPCTSLEDAYLVAEKLRSIVERRSIGGIRYLTVSIGIAQVEDSDDNIQTLINRADQALYKAKNSGRNRVE